MSHSSGFVRACAGLAVLAATAWSLAQSSASWTPKPPDGGAAVTLKGEGVLQHAADLLAELDDGGSPRQTILYGARPFFEAHAIPFHADNWTAIEAILHEIQKTREAERLVPLRQALARLLTGDQYSVRKTLARALPPLAAVDTPSDNGSSLIVLWRPAADGDVFILERQDISLLKHKLAKPDDPYHEIARFGADTYRFDDSKLIRAGRDYQYRLRSAANPDQTIAESAVVQPKLQWTSLTKKWNLLAVVAVIAGAMFWFIEMSKSGRELKIRKIAGLEAVDEAVGRATEMGRPVLFVPGIMDMNDIQTIAGLTVLGRVSRVAAEHDATLEVPTARSLVMTAARETVQTAYLNVGRPDGYDEKKIYYITDDQFGYVAAVTGQMVREKPATCFYMGAFFAESLILAETGNTTGSIQIAGTAMPAQLPFFVAACDYTLIGEEFFAASAYLSGEPQQLGSLKGQDVGKAIGMFVAVMGILIGTIVVLGQLQQSVLGDVYWWIENRLLNVQS